MVISLPRRHKTKNNIECSQQSSANKLEGRSDESNKHNTHLASCSSMCRCCPPITDQELKALHTEMFATPSSSNTKSYFYEGEITTSSHTSVAAVSTTSSSCHDDSFSSSSSSSEDTRTTPSPYETTVISSSAASNHHQQYQQADHYWSRPQLQPQHPVYPYQELPFPSSDFMMADGGDSYDFLRFSDIYGQPLSLTVAEPVPVATYGQYFYANQPQRLPTVFEEPDEEDGESDLEDCSERTEKQHNYSRNKADPENMEEVDSEDNFLGLWNSRATDMVENSFLPPPGLNLVRPQPVRIACPSTIYPLYRVEDTSDDADIHNPWKDFVFSKTAMNSTQTEENQDDDLMEGNQMSEA